MWTNLLRYLLAIYRCFQYRLCGRHKYGVMPAGVLCEVEGKGAAPDFGDVVHPCVRYIPEGFNGHSWWMVYTPYYKANAELENPILCYADGDSTTIPTDGRRPVSVSALLTAATARREGILALPQRAQRPQEAPCASFAAGDSRSDRINILEPARAAARASAASLSSAGLSHGSDGAAATHMERVVAGKSSMLRIRFSSSSVSTGRVIFTRRACSGVSARMFAWLPMYVIIDITSSSRIGSIGGFVTCAKSWWK